MFVTSSLKVMVLLFLYCYNLNKTMTQKYRAIQKNEICKVFETGKQRNVLTQYFQSKIVWPNIEEFILRTIQYKKPFFCTFPLFVPVIFA